MGCSCSRARVANKPSNLRSMNQPVRSNTYISDEAEGDPNFYIDNSEEEEPQPLTLKSESECEDDKIAELISDSLSSYDSQSSSSDNFYNNLSITRECGYKFVRKLGKGATSIVLEMTKGNTSYAIKVCDISKQKYNFFRYTSDPNAKTPQNPQGFGDPKDEVAILKRFSHPNVIKLYDFYEDDRNQKLFIIMELLNGGNIARCSTIDQKKRAFAQSVSALQYIHYQRIAHRDIKVDNILRAADGSIRITDFGISAFIPEGTEKISIEMKGTPAYSPPEMFSESLYDPFAADVWSLGITLYFLLFDKLPFIASKLTEIQRKVQSEEVKFPPGSDTKANDLLRKMLTKNPERRIKLIDIWKHPWMERLSNEVEKPNSVYISGANPQIYKSITPGIRKQSIQHINSCAKMEFISA